MTRVVLTTNEAEGSCYFILRHLNYGCKCKFLRVISLVERRSISHAQTHPACDVIRRPKFPRGYICSSSFSAYFSQIFCVSLTSSYMRKLSWPFNPHPSNSGGRLEAAGLLCELCGNSFQGKPEDWRYKQKLPRRVTLTWVSALCPHRVT